MKSFNKKILISIFIFLIVILLSISIIIANNTIKESIEINEEKIYYEIRYFDNEITYMLSLLNINEFIDWQELQVGTEKLYNYWNSTILDLNNLNIDKKHLTDFGSTLDNLIVSIKNQDRQGCLNKLIDLYNFLITYSEGLNYNQSYTNILYAKYNLLIAYSIVETGNWTLVHESILESGNYLSTIVNDMNNNQYTQYNINQAYIAVKELENIINIKDLDVFYIKYSIAINKLENL